MKSYRTQGTCSRQINFEVDNGILTECEFIGGCAGNTQGISNLVKGMKVEDIISKLQGTVCRNGTSCPDQLAKALKTYLDNNKNLKLQARESEI